MVQEWNTCVMYGNLFDWEYQRMGAQKYPERAKPLPIEALHSH